MTVARETFQEALHHPAAGGFARMHPTANYAIFFFFIKRYAE